VEETRWLTAEQQRAWRRFAAVVMQLPGTLDTQLQQDAHLTHFGYWVLAMLSESPGRALRMTELATLANGSQSRLSHLVGRLEERGWVRRERTPEDGRGYVAVLTDEGYQKVVETAPGHVAKVRSVIFDALTPEQIAHLDEISGIILAHLNPEATC